jgi:CheY-like chemotaxis protein
MKILIIDEDVSVVAYLAAQLQQAGHLVLTATEAPEALRTLYKEQPDLIISDNKLSCFSGLQLRNLVKLQMGKHIPILLFKTRKNRRKLEMIPEDAGLARVLSDSISRFD